MHKLLIALFVTSMCCGPALAQTAENVCPCIPKSPLWTVNACETWECAQSAMTEGNGSPYVVAIPTASRRYHWVVLRRIISGSAAVPDGPFAIESFDGLTDASALYASVGPELLPILTSTIDGKFVLLHLKEAEPSPEKPFTPEPNPPDAVQPRNE